MLGAANNLRCTLFRAKPLDLHLPCSFHKPGLNGPPFSELVVIAHFCEVYGELLLRRDRAKGKRTDACMRFKESTETA